jgi:hypothetical protein
MLRQLFEDKIGGLDLGDVFSNSGDILSLRIAAAGGLEKYLHQLQIKIKADGGLATSSSGLAIKLKPYGGLNTDTEGVFILSANIRAYRQGMQVTIKDATNLYVAGGAIEISGAIYSVDAQLTIPTGTLTAASTYYLYVNAPATGTTLVAGQFSISATVPAYNHAKGAFYMTGDATKRWMSTIKTA